MKLPIIRFSIVKGTQSWTREWKHGSSSWVGGASFNHLISRYTVDDPGRQHVDNAQILGALRNLKKFFWLALAARIQRATPMCLAILKQHRHKLGRYEENIPKASCITGANDTDSPFRAQLQQCVRLPGD